MTIANLYNRKQTVLIVDDSPFFQQRIKSLLNDVATIDSISLAGDYTEATHLIAEKKPDIILLDINMPGKNGLELLREIREAGDDCRVIMISNHTEECYRQQCSQLGADYFLDKSTDFGLLPEILERSF